MINELDHFTTTSIKLTQFTLATNKKTNTDEYKSSQFKKTWFFSKRGALYFVVCTIIVCRLFISHLISHVIEDTLDTHTGYRGYILYFRAGSVDCGVSSSFPFLFSGKKYVVINYENLIAVYVNIIMFML